MLDGTGNAAGDVQLGIDDLAGLPDLHVGGGEAGINGSPRGADPRVQDLGQVFQDGKVFLGLQGPAAGNDDLGLRQVDLLRSALDDLDDARPQVAGVHGHGLDLRGAPLGGATGMTLGRMVNRAVSPST